MKKFLVFVALFSSAITCFGQTINEQRERERIAENKIKEITVWNHKYANGIPSPKGYKSSETTYDLQGLPISVINYKSTGAISSKQSYAYDNHGNKTQYVNINGLDGKITYQQTIVYDNNNNKLLENGFDGSEPYRIVYKYNSQGKQSEIIRYKANNSIDEKWVYSYLGNKATITVYKPENVVSYTMEKVSDANGNIIEDIRKETSGAISKRYSMKFNDKNQEIQRDVYLGGKFVYKQFFTYDNFANLMQIDQTNANGEKFVYSKYKYDTKGNILEEQWNEGDTDEFSKKESKYNPKGVLVEVDTFYAPYNYKVLYKYTYEFYK
ncbi:MAG TPA: hypothetical protein VMV56_04360 [Williamwhitmania sp.]|nr:hypothetical protein [Williamwhitmania sp.]